MAVARGCRRQDSNLRPLRAWASLLPTIWATAAWHLSRPRRRGTLPVQCRTISNNVRLFQAIFVRFRALLYYAVLFLTMSYYFRASAQFVAWCATFFVSVIFSLLLGGFSRALSWLLSLPLRGSGLLMSCIAGALAGTCKGSASSAPPDLFSFPRLSLTVFFLRQDLFRLGRCPGCRIAQTGWFGLRRAPRLRPLRRLG